MFLFLLFIECLYLPNLHRVLGQDGSVGISNYNFWQKEAKLLATSIKARIKLLKIEN